jgi:hypothetical protein
MLLRKGSRQKWVVMMQEVRGRRAKKRLERLQVAW